MGESSVGFIGTGHMGQPMARNLLRAGISLRVCDNDPAKSGSLTAPGAQQVSSPSEAVEPGGIVISMVNNDQALEEIVTGKYGILERMGRGGIHVSMSTISIPLTQKMAALYAEHGSSYVVATVSGRPDVAEAAQLSIFYAGPQAAKERVLPFLKVLGNPERIYDLGEQAVAAAAVKIAFNYPIPLAIMAMAGAAVIAEKYGVSRQNFLRMFLASPLFSGNVYQGYGAMIADDVFEPALFPVNLGLKDVELMLDAAAHAGFSLPLAELYRDYLQMAIEEGWAEDDWAVAARVIARRADLPIRKAEGCASQ